MSGRNKMSDITTANESEFIKDFLEQKREIAKASQCSYRDFFTGKTVAVVGSSNSDAKNGKKIDDHDIVVRINSIIEYMPFSAEHIEAMGSRLDIVYLAASKARRYCHLKQRVVWKSKDVKPKFAVLRTGRAGDALTPPMCRNGGASRQKLETVLKEEGRGDIKVFVSSISGALIHKHFMEKLQGNPPLSKSAIFTPGRGIRLEVTWDGAVADMIRCKYIIKAYKKYGILNNVIEQSNRLLEGLSKIKEIQNLRNCGLIMGFDLENEEKRDTIVKILHNNALICNRTGERTIRLRPNLNINQIEIKKSLEIFETSFAEDLNKK